VLADSLGAAYRQILDPDTSRPVDGLDSYGGQGPQARRRDPGDCLYSVSCFTCCLPDCIRTTTENVPTPENLARRLGMAHWRPARASGSGCRAPECPEVLVWLKACTKCGGDLHSNSDSNGSYLQCLQCGLLQDSKDRIPETVDLSSSRTPPINAIA